LKRLTRRRGVAERGRKREEEGGRERERRREKI